MQKINMGNQINKYRTDVSLDIEFSNTHVNVISGYTLVSEKGISNWKKKD